MNKERFLQAISLLQAGLNFSLTPDLLKIWALLLKEELTDEELQQAVILAIKQYNRQPTPQQLIDLVRGTLRQRAIQEWIDEEYSPVGRTALNAIGGTQAKQTSEHPDRLLEKFIEVYVAIAHKSPPSATRRLKPAPMPILQSADHREVAELLAKFQNKLNT